MLLFVVVNVTKVLKRKREIVGTVLLYSTPV